MAKCAYCGKEFTPTRKGHIYCSAECKDHKRWNHTRKELKRKQADLFKQIVALYDSDLSTKEIATKLNAWPSQIYKAWRDAGLPKRLTPLQKEVKRLIYKGFGCAEIARITGKRKNTIRNAAITIGVYPEYKPYEKETRRCKRCGKEFTCHPKSNKLFCSIECQKLYSHSVHDIKRRSRLKDSIVDRDITLENLAERDHNICQICGGEVDWHDYEIINGKKVVRGNYPSRDHIVPLCKGGRHSWDNIQLAHIRCNAIKGAS